jgi:uncharacterized membrane protein YfcA
MIEFLRLFLLFWVGAVAGFINVGAGGGSIITLPALIFLGLNGALANGTNRLGVLVQNLFATSYFRQQNVHEFKRSLYLSLFTLPGAVVGAILSVKLDDVWFQRILAIVMIGVVVSMILSRSNGIQRNGGIIHKRTWLVYPAIVGVGFYGGFIQVGVGLLLMAALYHLSDMSLLHVNMHKVFIILVYTLPVLGVFLWTGNVEWGYGTVLAAGTALGAWWGARAAVKGGEKAVRYVLAVAVLLMSLKLLSVF